MSFSLAHIISSKSGLEIIARSGYQANWIVMGSCGIAAAVLYLIQKLVKEEQHLVFIVIFLFAVKAFVYLISKGFFCI
jgi:hypothetical protein